MISQGKVIHHIHKIRLFESAKLINEHFHNYSLLDMGCRTKALLPLLNDCQNYYGTDIVPAEGVYQCNLEKGLPQFQDGQFDIVTALDVLEHLDRPHQAFHEALRVAKKAVFISLPNMYYIKFRWNFLWGELCEKYTFPPEPIIDRHRWLLNYTESINFIKYNAKNYSVNVHSIMPKRGKLKWLREPAQTWLAKKWPNMFVYGTLFMIRK